MITLIYAFFIFFCCWQIFIYSYFYGHLVTYLSGKPNINFNKLPNKPYQGISVIICAKNEAQNIKAYLPLVLQQNYPYFEVVVVNDGSTDHTASILKSLQLQHTHLRVVTVDRNATRELQGKKFALQQGIAAATHELLLFTDADCYPNSKNWLLLMYHYFTNTKKQIVLGYGPYITNKTLLSKVISYETLQTALQYCSLALRGLPYMGVGRNLAYRKSLYKRDGNLLQYAHLLSGDDDLLIKQMANKDNVALQLQPAGFCYSKPPATWKAWIHQKKRHLSTGKYYKSIHLFLLGSISFSHFSMYIFLVLLLIINKIPILVFIFVLFAIRLLLQIRVLKAAQNYLKVRLSSFEFIIIDFLFIFYYVYFAMASVKSKTTKWHY